MRKVTYLACSSLVQGGSKKKRMLWLADELERFRDENPDHTEYSQFRMCHEEPYGVEAMAIVRGVLEVETARLV